MDRLVAWIYRHELSAIRRRRARFVARGHLLMRVARGRERLARLTDC